MAQTFLLSPGTDIITSLADSLVQSALPWEQSLIVFPGKRPALFLRKALAQRRQRAFQSPPLFSMDEFIDYIYERCGCREPGLSAVDGVGLLYRIHKQLGMPGAKPPLPLEDFLPWGFKLLRDLEDMTLEQVKAEAVTGIETIAGEAVPAGVRGLLQYLDKIYDAFYTQLPALGVSTRSSRYRTAAEKLESALPREAAKIIIAGFYGLSRTERAIFKTLARDARSEFFFQEGPGMRDLLAELKLEPVILEQARFEPELHFHKAADLHGEVMGLSLELSREKLFTADQVVVLPSAASLFPVERHALPHANRQYNISMGYPLHRTPVFALLEIMGRALDNQNSGMFYVSDYLKVVLHPYVKNLKLLGKSETARIVWHTIEEQLTLQGSRFITLEEIESSAALHDACLAKLAKGGEPEADPAALRRYLAAVHKTFFTAFNGIASLADFCTRLQDAVTLIFEESPAQLHPYSGNFMSQMLESLDELRNCSLSGETLAASCNYFNFLKHYLQTIRVPFEGTPLKGLQVLGFLETRNLSFAKLYLLDLNEGILPKVSKTDSLLPPACRSALGLSSYQEAEAIQRYYFYTLVHNCREVHLYWTEAQDKEKSRLAEELLWNAQKARGSLDVDNLSTIFFKADFAQNLPQPASKSPEIIQFLKAYRFSASSLDEYLHCPLKFYYHRVLMLEPPKKLGEGMEADERGTLVHAILRNFFHTKLNQPLIITAQDFTAIAEQVDEVFSARYGAVLPGSIYIIKAQVRRRMQDILRLHQQEPYQGSTILECEAKLSALLSLDRGLSIAAGGRLDRIDCRAGEYIILDYKTGALAALPNYKAFSGSPREQWHKTLKSVQLPFYILLYGAVHRSLKPESLNSSLMLLGGTTVKERMLWRQEAGRGQLLKTYREALATLIRELWDPRLDFQPTPAPETYCPACDYRVMCGRQWLRPRE